MDYRRYIGDELMNYVAAYLTTAQPNQDGAKGEKGEPGDSTIKLIKVKDV